MAVHLAGERPACCTCTGWPVTPLWFTDLMPQTSNFLPSIRYTQNNAAGDKQKSTLAQTVSIFLERPPPKNKVHWTCNCQQKKKEYTK
jgi:hypothetical protein